MERVRLADILEAGNIAVGIPGRSREEVLSTLIDRLPLADGRLKKEILASVLEREAIQTTGIGHGIAIPHGRAAIGPPILAAIGTTAEPIDYGSVDGTPVRIFILMVSRHDVAGPHVQALANVARLLGHRRFRDALIRCETPEEALELIRGADGG